MNDAPRWLDAEATADYISEPVHKLRDMVKRGLLPPPSYHLGPRKPRYDRARIDALFTDAAASPVQAAKEAARDALKARLQGRAAPTGGRHGARVSLPAQATRAHATGAG